ncbi:MAG: glycerophosphoryl diester phosphodiesterase membrane domain-containing protein [Planctomycetes bacterium]|nr:glycerophosphoryl diester phosphodiesterase membrane domain-containing protein [Planctomycetota bacterium]
MPPLRTSLAEILGPLRPRLPALVCATLLWRCLVGMLLVPLGLWIVRGLLELDGRTVAADGELAAFALSPYGACVLALLASLALGLGLAGQALALLVLAAPPGKAFESALSGLRALRARSRACFQLAWRVVLRCGLLVLPFALALVFVVRHYLGAHDINYYLAERPSELWSALSIGALLLLAAAFLLAAQLAAWGIALPLLLFEGASAREALRASARATRGSRRALFAQIAGAAASLLALQALAAALWVALARAALPALGPSLESLILLSALWLLGTAVIELCGGALRSACFALLQQSWYRTRHASRGGEPAISEPQLVSSPRRVSAWFALALLGAALFALLSGALALLDDVPIERCRIIAHRGSSHAAPENTLAAIRAAIAERADMVEIDVQETRDGAVVVLHDRDLMRVGGIALEVARSSAAELRGVELGARREARFAGERVPLLDEVLELARGRIHVLIELKRYAPGGRLPELVVERVEAAGLADGISCMSMDAELVRRLRALRPSWRVGALSAVSLGNLARVDAAFVAVRASRASSAFVREAQRRGKEVYVWTVNEPVAIARAFALGVDGVITDHPGLAHALRAERAEQDGLERTLARFAALLGSPLTPPPANDDEGPPEIP